jgi:poly(A) polymerase
MTTDLAEAAWLRSGPLSRVLAILDCEGEEARAVGGAVRDALLGRPVREVDVATTALPGEVVRRAAQAGIRSVPTGIEHGTVTLIVDEQPFEVTTLREDVETFGRKARVVFGRNWEHDAQRRDLTINALSAARDGTVFDYTGGLADLGARRVRFIGTPALRIAEDYLRILRFFRFFATYAQGQPDSEALAACIAGREGMDQLSRERVRMELLKLLVAPRAVDAIEAMAECGLLLRILGGVPYTRALARMVQIEKVADAAPDPVRRLGALAVSVREDAERLFQRLRLSGVEHKRLLGMAEGFRKLRPDIAEQDARALLYRLGADAFRDRICLAWSRWLGSADDKDWRRLADLHERWAIPRFPLSAGDLMARGLGKGPALGLALRAAEDAWIAADFTDDAARLNAIADIAVRDVQGAKT